MTFVTEDNITGLAEQRWMTAHSPRLAELMATPATVLGPFHIDGSPPVPFGFDMGAGIDGSPLFITGQVTDTSGRPLSGVTLDVWQADSGGYYETQLSGVDEARLRAKYQTRDDGTYCVRTIAPLGYAIPMDGPVGDLIGKTDISYFRPAHVHFLIEHPGYERLITHLFRKNTDFPDSDVIFGVKDQLIVRFAERPAGPAPAGIQMGRPYLRADYDFVLQPVPR